MKKIIGIFLAVCVMALSSCAYAADGKKRIAVVYFSATGTTRAVAERVAAAAGADIYEIVPAEKYSDADLNYRSDSSRANREMKDAAARPAIASDLSAAVSYDVVFVGYPIWWGTAPRIVSTFFETYDMKGAEIYLFCTSGSSGVSTSESDIKSVYPSLTIKGSRRLAGASDPEIGAWVGGLALAK